MKYFSILLIGIVLLLWTDAKSQSNKRCDAVYEKADVDPQYKNGSQDLLDFVRKDLMQALSKCIYNLEDAPVRLLIDLTIDKNGTVIDAGFRKSILTKYCEDQLKERLMKMKGWAPGKVKGKSVCCKYYLPIGCIKWDE